MSQPEMGLNALDHLVLTVHDLAATIAFYKALGMRAEVFGAADGSKRHALHFGTQKINLHQAGAEFEPKAAAAAPGTADLCFLTKADPKAWIDHLTGHGVPVIEGPVARSGATGPILSIYVRDPDGNLIEISQPSA